MLPSWAVRGYLLFLLRFRGWVAAVLGAGTLFFTWYHPPIFTNFFDLYPPRHPYIELYNKYRSMFGTANVLLMVVEVKEGTIFDDPETLRKVDRITLELLHDVPGVNGEQVLSITHPKLKTTLTAGSGIKVVPLTYPRLPEDAQDLRFFKQNVYTTEGVKGFFVSEDDTATLITAGFWEEYFDLQGMWQKVQEIVAREQDANTVIHVTGFPILYAYFIEALPTMVPVFLATAVAMVVLLWFYFRSLQGVVIPVFSGLMSAIWGLGFAGLCGFNIDPLVLVVPVLITARALSHSVQSMERYHEEYFRLGNKDAAIVKSYTELFPPAMVSIVSDGLAILTIAVASIPMMQKLAYVSSFWIVSIFLSVVTLHPIILSYVRPPTRHGDARQVLATGAGFAAVVVALAAFWRLAGDPLAALRGAAALSYWLETTTVVVFGVVAAVAVFIGARALTVRRLAGVAPARLERTLLLSERVTLAAVVLGAGAIGARWFGLSTVLVAGVGVVALAVLWGRAGMTADRLYDGICAGLIGLSRGRMRYAVVAGLVVTMAIGLHFAHQLKVGDTTPGAALLYPRHPYNVAFDRVNDKFVGASQLVVIAEGKEDEAIKRASTLQNLDLFGRYMEHGPGAGGSLTATTLLKKIFRTFHEGDPKWEVLPTTDDHVGQLFFLLTSSTRRGELDRFFDMTYRNATITVFYKHYNHEIIHDAIARAKRYIAESTSESEPVRYLLAGGLLGVLAAVNEEVDWSYRVNMSLILLTVFVLSVATYWNGRGAVILALLGGSAFAWWQLGWPGPNLALLLFAGYMLWNVHSVLGALIVMTPSLVAQPLSEAVMYLMGIDFNINSLPVAAVGIGIGIDYGYYVLSRIVEEYAVDGNFDAANRRAILTTGKAILFTGTTLTASVVFWLFFPMKFQAEMALLLIMLLAFHVLGALMVIPALVSLLRPRFAVYVASEVPQPVAAPARYSVGG